MCNKSRSFTKSCFLFISSPKNNNSEGDDGSSYFQFLNNCLPPQNVHAPSSSWGRGSWEMWRTSGGIHLGQRAIFSSSSCISAPRLYFRTQGWIVTHSISDIWTSEINCSMKYRVLKDRCVDSRTVLNIINWTCRQASRKPRTPFADFGGQNELWQTFLDKYKIQKTKYFFC